MAKKHSILVVDDEVNVAETLKMVLEQEGYRVITAHSATAAIAILAGQRKFDAVITDLNMEREDVGLDVVRAAQNQKCSPIVVVCTGYPSVQNLRSALGLHIDYVAIKPSEMRELLLALHRLLASRESVKQRVVTPRGLSLGGVA